MRVVTYNLRTDAPSDGVNSFRNRRGFVADKLESEMADIIGFQEVRPHMLDYLRSHMPKYMVVGCGRDADYKGESNPIAFKSDAYELLGLDQSWLSPMPFAPGSRYEVQSPCPRIITHAILKPVNCSRPFHFYNTHLDHESSTARVAGAQRLLDKIKEDQFTHPFPVVITGDFNAEPQSEEILLIKNDDFGLTDQTVDIGTTWHFWGQANGEQIDYIFTRGFRPHGDVEIWTDNLNGVYLSDHYPVARELLREDGIEC